MSKVLRWYMDGNISRTKVQVGGAHTLEADYAPQAVCLNCRLSGVGSTPLLVDIKDDGESISTDKPALTEYQTNKKWTTIPENTMREDSVITCDIDQIFNEETCRDLTVELLLREV